MRPIMEQYGLSLDDAPVTRDERWSYPTCSGSIIAAQTVSSCASSSHQTTRRSRPLDDSNSDDEDDSLVMFSQRHQNDGLLMLSEKSERYKRRCLAFDTRFPLVDPPLMNSVGSSSYRPLPQRSGPQETEDEANGRKPPGRKRPLRPPAATQSLPPPRPSLPPQPRAMQEEDPIDLVLDPEEVRRQQEILDDIQQRRNLSQTTRIGPSVASGHATGRQVRYPEVVLHTSQRTNPLTSEETQPSNCMMLEDQVKHMWNGRKVRVKGTQNTYKSIIKGQATLVQCPACQTYLQIGETAKLLYCPFCEQVSPIRSLTADDSAGISSTALDDRISCALQRTEVHIHRTVKSTKRQGAAATRS